MASARVTRASTREGKKASTPNFVVGFAYLLGACARLVEEEHLFSETAPSSDWTVDDD